MNTHWKKALAVAGMLVAAQAFAEVTFYEHSGYRGRSFTAEQDIRNFERLGFNDRASSAEVLGERGDRWEVCEDAYFGGRCVVLRPGQYPSLAAMGLSNKVSSVRVVGRKERVATNRYAPEVYPAYDDPNFQQPRINARWYEAQVTAARAVVGPTEQRCWIEKEQIVQQRSDNSVPGAIAGALIGGILGHQVGGGRGKDVATAGGAIAGAFVGNNIGSKHGGGQDVTTQDVQRCADVPNQSRPEYWDVTYVFRNQEHHAQMTNNPGATVTVNEWGEPRTD